ncbi:MAG TPA: Re/Si-specific NAD(P)(+) transhydrogenase subunit alpha [Candidatus Limnocylindria bacterium]|nr:Re/Si-specific NAD(P)(+) transhydrogenase subunit alpha [Candidatus Limnocylindria bacterium]
MRIGVPRETMPGERRVAVVPGSIRDLKRAGLDLVVERAAGTSAGFTDAEYEQAGATIGDPYAAEIVAKVQRPTDAEMERLGSGVTLIGLLQPLTQHALVRTLAQKGVTAIAMETIPRTTRAQPMDALSSQSNIGGYKAVLLAAEHLPRFFPMLTTAAGTVTPARVFVIGAGVAGLQAIATARRLGAVVEAFDTRPVVKEQVQSLGAKFIEIDIKAEGSGGYARELTPEEQQKQRELMAERVRAADVVITTALVPGRKAPVLVTADTVRAMRPGSVIVDMAAEAGGNVEGTEAGKVVVKDGVTLVGETNLPSTVPYHASQLYSRNVTSLLQYLMKDGALKVDLADEIAKGAFVTHEGKIVNEQVRGVVEKA